jgi:hypothetical protein
LPDDGPFTGALVNENHSMAVRRVSNVRMARVHAALLELAADQPAVLIVSERPDIESAARAPHTCTASSPPVRRGRRRQPAREPCPRRQRSAALDRRDRRSSRRCQSRRSSPIRPVATDDTSVLSFLTPCLGLRGPSQSQFEGRWRRRGDVQESTAA